MGDGSKISFFQVNWFGAVSNNDYQLPVFTSSQPEVKVAEFIDYVHIARMVDKLL